MICLKLVGLGSVLEIFPENFAAQRTIVPRSSWTSNFFEKEFMVPSISFNFLVKACRGRNKNKYAQINNQGKVYNKVTSNR